MPGTNNSELLFLDNMGFSRQVQVEEGPYSHGQIQRWNIGTDHTYRKNKREKIIEKPKRKNGFNQFKYTSDHFRRNVFLIQTIIYDNNHKGLMDGKKKGNNDIHMN